MKTLSAALALLVGAWVCPGLWADEAAKAGKVAEVIVERIQDLNLTDQQEAKIADIRKEHGPKVQEAGNKLRAAVREEVEQIVAVIKG